MKETQIERCVVRLILHRDIWTLIKKVAEQEGLTPRDLVRIFLREGLQRHLAKAETESPHEGGDAYVRRSSNCSCC